MLTGETQGRPGDDSTRVPIRIDGDVRTALNHLLYAPQMRGVGYSEFIQRAIDAAYVELEGDSRARRADLDQDTLIGSGQDEFAHGLGEIDAGGE